MRLISGLIKPVSAEPLQTKPYDSIFKKITLCGDWGEGKKWQGTVANVARLSWLQIILIAINKFM
ncbi:MAG: hypothetical protein WAW41_03675 [Methylobacter sp.]